MNETPEERLSEVMEMATLAMEQLDQAVGRATRLPIRERQVIRDYLLPPRNHLRTAVHALRRKLEEAPIVTPRVD